MVLLPEEDLKIWWQQAGGGYLIFFFFFSWRKILCPQVYQWQSFIFLAHVTCSFEETASTPGSSELKIPNADAFPLTERPVRPQVVLVSNRKVIRDCGFPKQLLFCLKFIVSFLLYIILSNSSKYCITSMELCFFFSIHISLEPFLYAAVSTGYY